jgi:hypothetical protein
MKKNGNITIDRGHEVYSPYCSKCAECHHFNMNEYTCEAYPDIIPDRFLSGDKVHLSVQEDQEGTTVFTPSS